MKNPNDAMSHIFKLQHVNILVYIVVASVMECSHKSLSLDTCIKLPYSYSMKKIFRLSLAISIIGNLSFDVKLIFNHKCCL